MPKTLIEPRMTIELNGTTYTIAIVDQSVIDDAGFEDTEGFTDNQKGIIGISSRVPDSRRMTVLWHEIVHAALGELCRSTYADLVRCSPKDAKKSEENLATYLGPILAAALPITKVKQCLVG